MLRVGIYRPDSVQRTNHVLKHALRAYCIYTNGVGVTLSVHSTGFPRTLTANRRQPDTPLFLFVVTVTSI